MLKPFRVVGKENCKKTYDMYFKDYSEALDVILQNMNNYQKHYHNYTMIRTDNTFIFTEYDDKFMARWDLFRYI